MAAPIIKLKRSAVEGKIPSTANVPLGELALNTYDGYLYASKDVGAGVTVIAINPWRVGTGTNTYNAYFTQGNVGINSTVPSEKLDVSGTIKTENLNVTGVSTFTGDILANSDSTVDIGTNSTRFANVYADTYYGSASNMTGLTGASAATYGDTSTVAQITVDSNGRITGITTVSISGGGGGISSVSEDTTPQLGGTLDTNGNLIQFGDSGSATDDRLQFGASQDLEIYHDGSNSFISDQGTGLLSINSSFIRLINAAGTSVLATFSPGTDSQGGSQLYFGGTKRFETTGAGVTITGVCTATSFSGDITGNLTGNADTATSATSATSATTATNANNINLADESTDTTCFPIFATTATGNQAPKTGSNLTFDSSNGTLTATSFSGDGSSVTNVDATTVDGVNSTSFLRSDAADQKTSGTLRFNDNVILALGSGDDAEFFVDGSHCYLDLNSGIGNFYIRDGTTTRFTFDDAGSFTATANVTAYSDITLKKNIELIPNALDKVLSLRGVTYNRIDIEDEPRHSGVIAQEVEEVLPEVVMTDEDGIKSVAYGNMVGLLIEAIKDQQDQINKLKEELEGLRK